MGEIKIALVGFRLSGGGSDRVMANLSNFFHKKGLQIHIIILHDELGYNYSGTVFNLGRLKSKTNSIFNKIKRFYYFNKYVKQHQFDFIIDFRFRINLIQEILINKYIYKTKTIYTIHSSKIDVYMPNLSYLTRFIYGNCYKIVTITKSMQNLVEKKHNLKNIINIYNPIDVDFINKNKNEKIDIDFKFIIGVGQYDNNVKQFDKLIEAYAKSNLQFENIALVILGIGKLENYLKKITKDFKVEHLVHFLGFKSNPYKYISKAKYFVLSSHSEGLPMVVLEALSCGTPVVAFDCPTGPKEIIMHKENGLLIEHQNINELIEAMNIMVTDEDLYSKCKQNAIKSVEKFSLDVIGNQWLELMDYN